MDILFDIGPVVMAAGAFGAYCLNLVSDDCGEAFMALLAVVALVAVLLLGVALVSALP